MYITRELDRQEAKDIGLTLANIHASMAQVLTKSPADTVKWTLYEYQRLEALHQCQLVGGMLSPWDLGWAEQAKKTKEMMVELTTQIQEAGMSDKGMVNMIADYAKLREKIEAESNAEHDRHADAGADASKPVGIQ